MSSRRLFIGIDANGAIDEEVELLQAENSTAGIRWIPPENLHVTLLFLGKTEEEKALSLISALDEVAKETAAFSLVMNGFVQAPQKSYPRMIWASFNEEAQFNKLAAAIRKQAGHLLPENKKSPKKPRPHITVARFREKKKSRDVQLPEVKQIELPVKEFILYESLLSPKGAKYIPLKLFSLSG